MVVVAGLLLAAVAMAAACTSYYSSTRKAVDRPASSSRNPRSIGGKRTGTGTRDQLELRAEELEKAGDLEGALRALKESHDRGSPRAVTLAHDLYQRHPGDEFRTKGCPMGINGFGQAGGLSAAASAAAARAAPAPGTDVPAASTCTAPEARLASAGVTAAAAALPAEGDRASEPGGEPRKSTEERGSSSAARKDGTPYHGNGEDAGAAVEWARGENQATVTQKSAAFRGWQGPEGFKPPRSAVTGSTTINEIAAGTAAVQAESSPPSSRNVNAGAHGDGLNAFDGGFPVPRRRGGEIKVGTPRPIYIALRGEVYDASAGSNLYGPGGEYSEFAGHDISRRVARGLSQSGGDSSSDGSGGTLLDDLSLEGLDRFEQMTLRGWEDTLRARGYPRMGRVMAPPPPRLFSRAELRAFDGRPAARAPSAAGRPETGAREGDVQAAAGVRGQSRALGGRTYAVRPIYVGVRDKVFDVSFGGSEFYLEGGPYECLAGRDASRVLAKMSMKKEDVEGVLDYSCLTDREEKNLADWVDKLGDGGKGYPVVGWLDLGL
ncbi:unnamed protein product [Scytosiphon promiscuus]